MLLDRRVVERNIRKGIVTRDEYEASLKALVDVSDNAEAIHARLGEHETGELQGPHVTHDISDDDT